MGAFFLFNKNKEFNSEETLITFNKKGFKDPIKLDLGNHTIFLYKKILTDSHNYFKDGDNIICAVGTFFYKNFPLKEVLQNLLKDLSEEKFERNELKGNYTFICLVDQKLILIKDPENLYNVFHTSDGSIISSSFLAVMNSVAGKLNLNKNVVRELLITGYIIGADTIIKDINRFDRQNLKQFKDLSWICEAQNNMLTKPTNYNAAIDEQLLELNSYFKKVNVAFTPLNCSIGVTGGFDSRLLIGIAKSYFKKPVYFSHFRKKINPELTVAKKITDALKVDLYSPKITEPNDKSEKEFYDQLEDAMFFLDGQIRASTFWTEEYNSLRYFKNFSSVSALNFNGIGGEQYRNGERILFKKKDIARWHYNETAFKFTGDLFSDKAEETVFLGYLNSKINTIFEIKSERSFSRIEIKKFLNEVFNPAGRCLRVSTENQAYFTLSPFTDLRISQSSYNIERYLGLSMQFETDMIKKAVPELNNVQTAYGYSIAQGEPLKSKFLTIVKELMPSTMYYKMLYKRKKPDQNILSIYSSHTKVEEYFQLVKNLNLNVDVERLKQSAAHSPHIIALGFFLNYFSEKIKYD